MVNIVTVTMALLSPLNLYKGVVGPEFRGLSDQVQGLPETWLLPTALGAYGVAVQPTSHNRLC